MTGPLDPAHSDLRNRLQPLWDQLAPATLIACAMLWGSTQIAQADCTPPEGSVQSGDSVTCSGDNFIKYTVPQGTDNVTLSVEDGATFQSLNGSIVLRDLSNLDNSGDIYVTSIGTVGVTGGSGTSEALANYVITPTGSVEVLSADARGVSIQGFSNVVNQGLIRVSETSSDSFGIQAGGLSNMSQEGQLLVLGQRATGVSLGSSSSFDNSGSLVVSGEGATGVYMASSSSFDNTGELEVSGTSASGLVAVDTHIFDNNGNLVVSGEGATGAALGQDATVNNYGTIEISGIGNAVGVSATSGAAITNWNEIVITESATGATGLVVGNDYSLIENLASVTATATAATGVRAGNYTGPDPNTPSLVRNRADMTFSGDDSIGIQIGDRARAENTPDGIMTFTGDSSIAITGSQASWVDSTGRIEMQGANSRAIVLGDGTDPTLTDNYSYLVNFRIATVELSGDDSVGLEVGQYGWNENRARPDDEDPELDGILIVTGDRSTAMRSGPDSLTLNSGLIQVGGTDSVGIHADGYTSSEALSPYQTFLNDFNGKVESIDPNAGPLILLGEGLRSNLVQNSSEASIEADTTLADVEGRAIAIQGSQTDDEVINYGLMIGKVRLAGGNDIYRTGPAAQLADLGEGTVDGGEGEGFDIFALDGTNRTDPETGDLIPGILDASLIRNFDVIRIERAIWTIEGNPAPSVQTPTTDLVVGPLGTLRLDSPLTVDGNYSHELPSNPDDTNRARVLAVLSEDTSDTALLQVTGTADLADGILELDVPPVRTGHTFSLIEADGGLLNAFDSVLSPGFSGSNFGDLIYGSNLLQLVIPAYSPNQIATADYIDNVPRSGQSASLTQLLDTIDGLSYVAYGHAMNQLMPEAYDAQAAATLELANTYTTMMFDRPNYCIAEAGEDSKHPSTGLPCRPRRFEPWMNVYGQKYKRTGSDDHISYRNEGGGVIVGLDHRVGSQLLLTGTVGTAYDVIRVDDVGKGRLTTVDIGFAGAWSEGPLRIQGAASYGYGWNQRYRNVTIGDFASTTRAEYGMNRVGVRGRAEYAFRFWKAQIAPLASVDYTALIRPAIEENSGGPANLYIDEATNHITTVRVGFDLSSALHKKDYWTDFLENADGVWRPRLSVAWRQVVTGEHRKITSRLSEVPGNVFTIQADAADRGFEIGAGIDWSPKLINRFSFGVHYDGFLWKDVQSHNLVGRVRFTF